MIQLSPVANRILEAVVISAACEVVRILVGKISKRFDPDDEEDEDDEEEEEEEDDE